MQGIGSSKEKTSQGEDASRGQGGQLSLADGAVWVESMLLRRDQLEWLYGRR